MNLLSGTNNIPLDDMLSLINRVVSDDEYSALRDALVGIARRYLEVALLRDHDLLEIGRYSDVYAGRARAMIRDRLAELRLNAQFEDADVKHLEFLLIAGAFKSRRESVTPQVEYELFRAIHLRGLRELRCEICGYHFCTDDLSTSRRELSAHFDLGVAAHRLPERLSDPLKSSEESRCEIDHLVPRAGWGPTLQNNLQVLCQYCNRGKSLYRWWGESLPATTAGSLASISGEPYYWQMRQSFVAALLRDQSVCRKCGATRVQTEISVIQKEKWISPTSLESRCYRCVSDSGHVAKA